MSLDGVWIVLAQWHSIGPFVLSIHLFNYHPSSSLPPPRLQWNCTVPNWWWWRWWWSGLRWMINSWLIIKRRAASCKCTLYLANTLPPGVRRGATSVSSSSLPKMWKSPERYHVYYNSLDQTGLYLSSLRHLASSPKATIETSSSGPFFNFTSPPFCTGGPVVRWIGGAVIKSAFKYYELHSFIHPLLKGGARGSQLRIEMMDTHLKPATIISDTPLKLAACIICHANDIHSFIQLIM